MDIKHVANIITLSRIVSSTLLLFIKPLTAIFYVVWVLCGASDVLDGYVARKTENESRMGAMLDSIADTLLVVVALIVFIPIIDIPYWLLLWIGIIALMRCISLAVGFQKYHAYAPLHTYANKVTGFTLFLFPILYGVFDLKVTGCILCVLASLSAVEEMLIHLNANELDRDVKSIFV